MNPKSVSGTTMIITIVITLLMIISSMSFLIKYGVRAEEHYQHIINQTTKTALCNNIRVYIVEHNNLSIINEWKKVIYNFECYVRVLDGNEFLYVDFKTDRLPNSYIRGEVATYYNKNIKYYRLVKWYWVVEDE